MTDSSGFLGVFFSSSLLDNHPDQWWLWSLALVFSGCQLKVIDHVAFIMPPSGGVGDNTAPCVGVCSCTCMHFTPGWGRRCFKTVNSGNALLTPTPHLSLDIHVCV